MTVAASAGRGFVCMERVLRRPFLTSEAAAAAARLRAHHLPAWLIGEANGGLARVARALHDADAAADFVAVRLRLTEPEQLYRLLRRESHGDPPPRHLTLYVERIDRQPLEIQEEILRRVESGFPTTRGDRMEVRLLAHSERLPAPGEVRLLAPLRSFLEPFLLRLDPLAERPDDIVGIARVFCNLACEELGVPAAPVSLETVDRLAESRSWRSFDELGTAVRRRVVEQLASPGVETPRTDVPPAGRGTDPAWWLEFVTTELAHELKNPMVTIKTFTQQMDTLLSDPALRDRFVALTRDAVDRMDGFMEELLQFSRFGDPRRRSVPLLQILSGASAEIRAGRVKLDDVSPDQQVLVDEDQIVFAFRAFFRGILAKLPEEGEIVVSSRRRGVVQLTSRGEIGVSAKLQNMLQETHADLAGLPLRVILGRILVERNDGSVEVSPGPTSSEVSVTLPVAP